MLFWTLMWERLRLGLGLGLSLWLGCCRGRTSGQGLFVEGQMIFKTKPSPGRVDLVLSSS